MMRKIIQILLIFLTLLVTSSFVLANDNGIDIKYRAHVADKGWIDPMVDLGNPIGTTGEAKQLECIEFKTSSLPEGINLKARGHVSEIGWQDFITDNGEVGTTGRGLALEAIELKFESNNGTQPNYDLYYRTHVANVGWLGWAKNGETAGTSGFAFPIESIETLVVPAGQGSPENTTDPYLSQDKINELGLEFSLFSSDGNIQTSNNTINAPGNTTLDGLSAKLNSPGSSIAYQVFCSNIGWCGWNQDTGVSGNGGNQIEALQFELHGDLANKYNIYYQVSIPYYGWNDWTSNGGYAGTMNGNLPINGLRVKILPKEIPIQENTYRAFYEVPQYFRGRGVMVSIPLQLVFVKDRNNQIVFISDCTTGNPETSNATPTGSFHIIKKSRNVTLVGSDYRDFVNYWIPFIGQMYGFHDASWRNDNEFGRDVYTYNESHGCINMRLNEVAIFNGLVRPGDLVVIH